MPNNSSLIEQKYLVSQYKLLRTLETHMKTLEPGNKKKKNATIYKKDKKETREG